MRRSVPLFLLAIVCAGPLPAQSLNSALFLTVGGGLGAYDNGPFSHRLRSFTPLNYVDDPLVYQTEEFSNTGATLNAGLGVLVAGRLMIGASGERVMFPAVHSVTGPGAPQDEYQLTGTGGGIDLGWAVVNEDALLLAPFAQVGYYGYSLDYHNNQTVPVSFFFAEGTETPSGGSSTFSGAGARFALGLQLLRFLAPGAGGTGSPNGLLLSARLSYGSMLERPLWEKDGVTVNNGGHTPAFNSLELTIGIGGALGWK